MPSKDVAILNFLLCSCGAVIGLLVPVNGEKWLDINGVVQLRNGHGRCCNCGRIWHYDALDGQLDDLVKRVVESREVKDG